MLTKATQAGDPFHFGKKPLVNHDLRRKLYSGNTLEKGGSQPFSSWVDHSLIR